MGWRVLVDAYRIEVLSKNEAAPGISMLILGYRLGSILAKAGPLYLAQYYSWKAAYVVMAALTSIGIVATIFSVEPPALGRRKKVWLLVAEPFQEFFLRSSLWWLVLVFVIWYRWGDALLNTMAFPFYSEVGFSKAVVASVTNVFGVWASVLGSFVGAIVLRKTDIFKGLFFCGLLHTLSHFMYILVFLEGPDVFLLYSSVALENVTGGMSTTAFFLYLSRLCKMDLAATQFALLTSLWSLSTPLSCGGGWIVDRLNNNWMGFFGFVILVSIPPLMAIPWLKRYGLGNSGVELKT